MMLNHIRTEKNKVIFSFIVKDKHGDVITTIPIGDTYGIVYTRSDEELKDSKYSTYDTCGIFIDYTGYASVSVTVNGEVYTAPRNTPDIGDSFTWRGKTYYVGGVEPKINIWGDLVGYKVYTKNG